MSHTRHERRRVGVFGRALDLLALIYHSIVRNVRQTHSNALMAIFVNVVQTVVLIIVFYVILTLLNLQGAALRGDFLIYIMSGIFLFMTHTKALAAVVGADGPTSPMMQHAPMNTIVALVSAALGTLYVQVLSMLLVLFVYHAAISPFENDDPAGAFAMLMLAWFTGVALGVVLLALKPWAPGFVRIFTTVYQRANMLASGKTFVGNNLPAHILPWFEWNPLFHTIDQARGYTFVNYFPRNSSWDYPLYVGLALLMIGLMGEFTTRRAASRSWYARR